MKLIRSIRVFAVLLLLCFACLPLPASAAVLIFEHYDQSVPDNSPVGGAPGWRAYGLTNASVVDFTSATPGGNYPSLSHGPVGAGSGGVGYLVMGAGNAVSNVLLHVDSSASLAGASVSDVSFYTKNNAAGSKERVVVQVGGLWYASTATYSDAGGNSVWTLNTFPFTTAAASWRTLNTNTLTLGATLVSPLPGGTITAIGAFGEIQADAGKIRFDEFQVSGVLTSAPPVVSLPVASPGTNVIAGSSVTLTESASGGSPLAYQWRKAGINLTNGPSFTGVTSSILTLSNAAVGDSGSYDVVVSNPFGTNTSPSLALNVFVSTSAPVDLSAYNTNSAVVITRPDTNTLVATWADRSNVQYRVSFNLNSGQVLLARVETAPTNGAAFTTVAQNVDAKYRVTLGSRAKPAGALYVFFDRVDINSPAPVAHLSNLDLDNVRVISESANRVRLEFSTLELGPFTGDMTCTIFNGSPLVQFQATMLVDQPWTAYLYDALLYANFTNVAYKNSAGVFQTTLASSLPQTVPGEAAKLLAKHRTVMGTMAGGSGTLAVVLPPHAGFYPLDQSDNYGFLQAGKTFIGTKMTFNGDNRLRPWVDAPVGSTQRMDAFLFISTNTPPATLTNVLAYTHGDFYKPLPGHYTMEEHFHPEFTANNLSGGDSVTPFKQAMQAIGLQIVMPKEFHGPGNPMNNTSNRLVELNTMFTLCENNSDTNFLIIPGEEYNNFFGGHWSYTFPKKIFFTGWSGQGGRDFKQTNVVSGGVTYPIVYQVGDSARMEQLLEEEGGLAWVSHPRIKGSRTTPDSFVNTSFYQSDSFLAGDWKSLPSDLSKDRLGFRGFQLMDDTAQWGYRKSMMGACDTFALNLTHEIYAHMNVNYLQLPAFPSKTNWSSVVDCLREGQFFTTTGEILIHSWAATTTGVVATVEWYFPPAFAEITWGDANGVHKWKMSLADRMEFDTQQITFATNLASANWVRFETWDVARNGAFTQPFWFTAPANPTNITGRTAGFTLINTDDDVPVPGFDPITNGAVLDLALLPPNLTIRANVSPLIMDSVTVTLDGNTVTRTTWPYSHATCVISAGIADSPFYNYAPSTLAPGNHVISATPWRGTNAGTPLAVSFTVTDPNPSPKSFNMNGVVDSGGYQIASNGGLYAAVRSNALYVAAPATGVEDQFIFVTDNPGSLAAAPWSKSGQVAFDIGTKPYLSQNGATRVVSWANGGASATNPPSVSVGMMEGVMDLVQVFGAVPTNIYIALGKYGAGNGGALIAGSQVPTGNGNGTIEAGEFLLIPIAAIRDENQNGELDIIEPSQAFKASHSANATPFIVHWRSVPDRTYQVSATTNLPQPFEPLSGTIKAGPNVFSLSYTDAPPPAVMKKFYRVGDLTSPAKLLARFQLNSNATDIGPLSLATTATGITYTNDNREGGASARFDGATSSVVCNNGANPVTGSFSVAFWMRTSTVNPGATNDQWFTGGGIVDAETPGTASDWGITMTASVISFGIGGGNQGANFTIHSPPVNDGAWHHIVATWEQSPRAMTIYRDGISVATGVSNSNEDRTGGSALTIGKISTGTPRYTGQLDDIQIYDRALGTNEVSTLFNAPGQALY